VAGFQEAKGDRCEKPAQSGHVKHGRGWFERKLRGSRHGDELMASIETWVAGIIALLPDRYEQYEGRADGEALSAIVRMVWAEGNDYVGDLENWIATGEAARYELSEEWGELGEEGRSWFRAYRALALYVQRAGVPDDAVEGVHLSRLLAPAEEMTDHHQGRDALG
jgi:hypothetical protein